MEPLRTAVIAAAASYVGSVLVVLLGACTDVRLTPIAGPGHVLPADPPTIDSTGSIWGYVVDSSGICLTNITVEIVSGPGTGRQMVQAVPCDAWAYGNGFWFNNLPLGVTVTVRAKRPGYKPQDVDVLVRNSGYADLIELLPE